MPSQFGHGDPFNRVGKARDEKNKADLRHHTLTKGIGKRIRDAMEANGSTEEEITGTLNWMLDTAQISREQAENYIYNMKAEAKAKTKANPNWREELRIQRQQEKEQEWARKQAEADLAKEQAEAQRAKEIEAQAKAAAEKPVEEKTIAIAEVPSKPISGSTVLISVSFTIVAIVVFAAAFFVGRHIRDELDKPKLSKKS